MTVVCRVTYPCMVDHAVKHVDRAVIELPAAGLNHCFPRYKNWCLSETHSKISFWTLTQLVSSDQLIQRPAFLPLSMITLYCGTIFYSAFSLIHIFRVETMTA